MIFFEDTKIGERHTLGSFTFTADAIKTFARAYDPQAFHLDEEAGRRSLLGGLAASGWHTASVFTRRRRCARWPPGPSGASSRYDGR